VKLGFKLIAEAYGPAEIVEQAVRAEEAGFDFVEVSDHFHPWVSEHEHSGFAFAMLGAIAARTSAIGLATGVTCPFVRYHPAIVAQAAATIGVLSRGRFTLGLGAGERLNEHVVGAGWPAVATRHEMLREALEIIRLLWSGGYHSYEGKHLRLEDARVFDLPDQPPAIAVAAGGAEAARLAGELGDALFVTEPREDLVAAYEEAGGDGPKYAEVPLAWASSVAAGAESARRTFRFALSGWKVQAELPNPVNFDAATELVTPDHLREQFACGPDVERHVEIARPYAEAAYDHLALINAGPDPGGFFDFFSKELGPALREIETG
jgi:G6PDH family F420-dependent oxidoreductase